MKKLTNKALENFFLWLSEQGTKGVDISNFEFNSFLNLSKVSKNALIIEWFDSVGIYIDTESEEIYEYVGFYAYVNNESLNTIFESRQKAIEEAIIIANNIYNETN